MLEHRPVPAPSPGPSAPPPYGLAPDEATEGIFYLGAGPAAAIALGIALVPLRELTSASNLTFLFLALTIAVAELGGRRAAVATALVSAFSLDFFLTRPYLRLTIEDKHDVIAFAGLAACGVIAATLGAPRRATVAALRAAKAERDLLRSLLAGWQPDGRLEPPLTRTLRASQPVLGLAAAVVRDERDNVLANTAPADALRPLPRVVIDGDRLGLAAFPGEAAIGSEGARLALSAGRRRIGWLDVWRRRTPIAGEQCLALHDLCRAVTLVLAADAAGRGRPPADPIAGE